MYVQLFSKIPFEMHVMVVKKKKKTLDFLHRNTVIGIWL